MNCFDRVLNLKEIYRGRIWSHRLLRFIYGGGCYTQINMQIDYFQFIYYLRVSFEFFYLFHNDNKQLKTEENKQSIYMLTCNLYFIVLIHKI